MPTRTLSLLAAVALVLSACGSGADELTITDPWGRPSPSTAQAAAFYMDITNSTDTVDTLIAASADVCETAELHESSMDDAGVMSMSELEFGVPIPAGATASLEPGGMHVMCISLDHELEVGEMVPVVLDFETAPSQTIQVEIRDQ